MLVSTAVRNLRGRGTIWFLEVFGAYNGITYGYNRISFHGNCAVMYGAVWIAVDNGVVFSYIYGWKHPARRYDMVKVCDRIRIVEMVSEPHYDGREGVVEYMDSMGRLHGTWGGLAVQPDRDTVEVLDGV